MDLTHLSYSEIELLVTAIKDELTVTPNCDFKPCGYNLDVGSAIEVMDHNTFMFTLQGSAVRQARSEGEAEKTQQLQNWSALKAHDEILFLAPNHILLRQTRWSVV